MQIDPLTDNSKLFYFKKIFLKRMLNQKLKTIRIKIKIVKIYFHNYYSKYV